MTLAESYKVVFICHERNYLLAFLSDQINETYDFD